MEQARPSAADHEWREIVVHIYPHGESARFVVLSRKNKGSDMIWQRNLCTVNVDVASDGEVRTLGQVLDVAAACLLEAAQRATR